MATQTKVIGPISAYAIAVQEGYTGSKAEWAEAIGNAQANAAAAEAAADRVQNLTESLPDDFTDTIANFAPTYSTSSTYAVGDYVIHYGSLYRCITKITTAEAWTPAHWAQVSVGEDLAKTVWHETQNLTSAQRSAARNNIQAADQMTVDFHSTQISDLETGKQDKLTFDSTPTAGSSNPVTSAGIKTVTDALAGDVDDLKSAIDIIGTSATEDTPAYWVSGGLNQSMTGTNTNTDCARIAGANLERLPKYGVVSVEIPPTLLCRVAVYTDRNFPTVVARITGYSGAESTRTNGSVKIPSEYNGLYLGMDCKKVDGTDFTAEERTALSSQIVVKTTTLIGDISDLNTNDKSSAVGAINENKSSIDEFNSSIYGSSNAEYTISSTYPLGFVRGYFSSTGLSKTTSTYSRNAFGINIDEDCKSIRIIPKENVTLNYCIFSAEPLFDADADNSSILLANGGGFVTGERIIDNPPVGLLYVSHQISVDNLIAGDRPAVVMSGLKFITKEYATSLIGDLSDLETDNKNSVVDAINENKNAIDRINDDIYDSLNAEYVTDSTYPLGFRRGFFSSAGISKIVNDYSRNAIGIQIDENCKGIRIIPTEDVTLNYCIFSEEPSFALNADNSNILLANGGGFITGERTIDNPPVGLLYVSHQIGMDDLTAGNRPAIILSGIRISDAKEYEILGYTRDYTDITWQLNFERKQISVNGIEDSTTHVIAKLPNIGCIEVRMNTPAGKFAVFKDTNGTITQLCDYTTYQYHIFADYVSDYYIDITNISVTALTIANARKYVLAYLYSDTGEYRKTEYRNKLFGMNIAFIGDSITQGRFHETGTDKDTDGTNYTMSKPYPVLVAEICGDRNVMNYGIGGALVYDSDWKSLYRNCGNVAGYDYVFVHAGTNDYGGNVSSEAFTSAYNYVISTLKANNTNVVVLTPVTRTNRTSQNTENLYLKDYADIEKTIAEQQSCNVIDLLTLTNNSTFKSLLSDGLHPNEMGHAYIADLILKGM